MIRYGHWRWFLREDGVTAKPIDMLNDCPADLHTYAYNISIYLITMITTPKHANTANIQTYFHYSIPG